MTIEISNLPCSCDDLIMVTIRFFSFYKPSAMRHKILEIAGSNYRSIFLTSLGINSVAKANTSSVAVGTANTSYAAVSKATTSSAAMAKVNTSYAAVEKANTY